MFGALGALAGDVAHFSAVLQGQADPRLWTLKVLGVAATVAVTVIVTRLARQAMAGVDQES